MLDNIPTLVWFLLGFALVILIALAISWATTRGKLKAEVERLRGAHTKLESDLQEARDTHNQYKLQLDAMSEERSVLSNSISELKQNKTAMESNLSQLENSNAELDAELTARGSELQRTQQRLSKLQGEFGVLSKARSDLEVMLTDSELAGNALRDEVRAANMQIVAYHKALDTAKESHLAEVDALRVAADLAKKAYMAETTALATNVSSTAANIAAKDQRIATLESDMIKLRSPAGQTPSTTDAALVPHVNAQNNDEAAALKKSLTVMTGTLAEKEQHIALLEEKLAAAQEILPTAENAVEPTAFAQPALLPPDETETAKDLANSEVAEAEPQAPSPEEQQTAWLFAKRAKFHWPDGVKTRLVSAPVDLTEVVGVDAAQCKALQAEGIGTFWELANTRDDILNHIFNPDGGDTASVEDLRSRAWVLAEKTDSVGCVWAGKTE